MRLQAVVASHNHVHLHVRWVNDGRFFRLRLSEEARASSATLPRHLVTICFLGGSCFALPRTLHRSEIAEKHFALLEVVYVMLVDELLLVLDAAAGQNLEQEC